MVLADGSVGTGGEARREGAVRHHGELRLSLGPLGGRGFLPREFGLIDCIGHDDDDITHDARRLRREWDSGILWRARLPTTSTRVMEWMHRETVCAPLRHLSLFSRTPQFTNRDVRQLDSQLG